jgi:hypothetical protein
MSSRIGVVDLRGGAASAGLSVCGLPVAIRNLLLLQRAGIGRSAVLLEPNGEPKARKLIERFARRLPRVVVIAGPCDTECLERALGAFESLLFWPGELSFGRFLPELAQRAPERATLATHEGRELGLSSIPRVDCVSGVDISMLASVVELERSEERRPPVWVRTPADVPQAERELLLSLRKDADGVVARIDRYASLAISRRLMRAPVTPNQVTIAALLLGIGCGLVAAHGGYGWMLAGAVLFQLNSIFDGIDGEIARAKLLESRLGQWLDTVSDDLSNFAFIVGVGVGCYRSQGWIGYLALGAIGGLGQLLTSALQYHYLLTVAGSGDLNDFRLPWEEHSHLPAKQGGDAGAFARLAGRLKWALRRDAFVAFSTIAALLGQLRVLIWLFAAGASSIWLSIVVYRMRRRFVEGDGR